MRSAEYNAQSEHFNHDAWQKTTVTFLIRRKNLCCVLYYFRHFFSWRFIFKIRALFVISPINNNRKSAKHSRAVSSSSFTQLFASLSRKCDWLVPFKNYFHHCYNKSEWLDKYTWAAIVRSVLFFSISFISYAISISDFDVFLSALGKCFKTHKKFDAHWITCFEIKNRAHSTKHISFRGFFFSVAHIGTLNHTHSNIYGLRWVSIYIVFCISKQFDIYFWYSIAKLFEKWFHRATNLCLTSGSCSHFFW